MTGPLANLKYEKFAQALALGEHRDKAYVLAGYRKSATNALALSKNKQIRGRVAELLEQQEKRVVTQVHEAYRVNVERTMLECARLGFSDIRNCVTWTPQQVEIIQSEDGTTTRRITGGLQFVPSAELSADAAAAIKSVKQTKDGAISIELHPKQPALDAIAKTLGMSQSQNEMRQDNDQPLSTMEAARRLAFLLASAKEEQKRQMVDVTPNASDPERQT